MTPAELLVAIAGHGLHPSPLPINEQPLGPAVWQELLGGLRRELLLGLALNAADSGALTITTVQRKELSECLALAQDRRSKADRCLDEVIAALHRQGIETCLIHDAATAALDYDQPDLRLYDTLHLLVPPGRREEAVTTLMEQGIVDANDAKRRAKRQTSTAFASPEGIRVVLSTSLTPKNVGATVEADDLIPSRVTFTPRSVAITAPGREERLIAASVHARLNEHRKDLFAQRDLVQLVLREDLSVRRVERRASSWRLEAVVAEAVRAAWEVFRVPDIVPISAWSRSYQPYRRDRRRLAAYPLPSFGV